MRDTKDGNISDERALFQENYGGSHLQVQPFIFHATWPHSGGGQTLESTHLTLRLWS